jgi:DNA-binding response OmpR family regulator
MDPKPSRILIVEDDQDLAEMLHTFFRVQSYEVQRAAWGKDALELAKDSDFDLFMLDIRLPDISGYEVCRQLRLNRRSQDVPIIFLTEKRDRIDRLQGLELGVVDYITKPFDIQELRLRVRNAIQRAAMNSMLNAVTQLPDVLLTNQRLQALLYSDTPWALLRLHVQGLDRLRERMGFIAADEMMRAVALLVKSALREHGGPDDVAGHAGPDELILFTSPDRMPTLADRVETRVRGALIQFYNPIELENGAAPALELGTSSLTRDASQAATLAELKSALGVQTPEPKREE